MADRRSGGVRRQEEAFRRPWRENEVRDYSGSNHISSGGGEKWVNSGCILKVQPTVLVDRLSVLSKKKKGV